MSLSALWFAPGHHVRPTLEHADHTPSAGAPPRGAPVPRVPHQLNEGEGPSHTGRETLATLPSDCPHATLGRGSV